MNVRTVGLLATPKTIKSHLYKSTFEQTEITLLYPQEEELAKLEIIIRSVIAFESTDTQREEIERMMNELASRGAEKVILGCTELSVLMKNNRSQQYIDPLEITAKDIVRKYYE